MRKVSWCSKWEWCDRSSPRNVNNDHLTEIIASFGKIKEIQFGSERQWPWLNKGFAYKEYEGPADSQNAIKHMYEGQIDG